MNRFPRLLITTSFAFAAVAGVTLSTAAPAMAATSTSITGSSADLGATVTGTLTWQDRKSFTATVKLSDATCDDHQVYFYFSINAGSNKAWQGRRRSNDEGCQKSVEWSGISAKDDSGISGPSLVVCTDLHPRADACQTYDYENPYFT